MPAVGEQHIRLEPVEDLVGQIEKHGPFSPVGGAIRPAGGCGKSVTRTPPTVRSITSAVPPVPRSAWNRRTGSSRVAKHLVEGRFPLGVEDPAREKPGNPCPARPAARATRACTRPRRWRGRGNNESRRRAIAWVARVVTIGLWRARSAKQKLQVSARTAKSCVINRLKGTCHKPS